MPDGRYQSSFILLVISCSMLFFSACAFPRIVVLDDPLTPEEHLNLGVAYEKKGELDSAIKEYQLAAKNLSIGYLYLGNAHFHRNNLSKAEACYKQAIDKEPQNADAYNNLAWLYYMKRENLDEAESFALKAIELDSCKKHIYGDTLQKVRKLKESIR